MDKKYNSQKTTLIILKGRSAMINIKKPLNILLIIIACLLLIAASDAPKTIVQAANDSYELTFQSSGSGTTNPLAGIQTYTTPSPISIMAIPTPGYGFVSWTVNPPSAVTFTNPNSASTTATPNGNGTVTATFVRNTYTVSVSILPSGAAGTVTPNATGPYQYGDTVVLTEATNNGYTFSSWSGAGVGTGTTRTVSVIGNLSVIANYSHDAYTLSVNHVGSGSVSVNPSIGPYYYGDNVILNATAQTGWVFSGWSGSLTSNVNPVAFTINGNTSLTATFTQSVYSLSPSIYPSSLAGSIVSNASGPLHYGDVVVLTETPSSGYTFSGWSGDGTGTGPTRTVTITGNMITIASYTQNTYTLSVTSTGSGSYTINPDRATYHYGDTVVLTATASPGWAFSGWGNDVASSQNPLTITITNSKSISASFTQTIYQIVFSTSSTGTVSPTGTQTYLEGQYVPIQATPADGYLFSAWTVSPATAAKFDNANSATAVATIKGNGLITATFAPKPSPSPSPTPSPTPEPTSNPTVAPTNNPTSNPTQPSPSKTPTPTSPTPKPSPTLAPGSVLSISALTISGKNATLTVGGNTASSTISSATITTDQFNTTTTVSLTVIAQNSISGLGNITIPKTAIPYGTTPIVYVNNNQSPNQGYTQDANNYYIWYSTGTPTYALSIAFGTSPISESFPYWAVLTIAIITVVAVVTILIFRKKRASAIPDQTPANNLL
jgi:uncharacterized repeat protein (TIGR02543 family)